MNRSYKLKLYPNKKKFDTARYTIWRMNYYANCFLGKIYFGQRNMSTAGMGKLANDAKHKAVCIISAQRASQKATKMKTNVPFVSRLGASGNIEVSKSLGFDYWVYISNQWTKRDGVRLPAKSHKALNRALRNGWIMSDTCECKLINGDLYAVVFLKKTAPAKITPKQTIGCDVGVKHSVVTSDGYLGHGLYNVIRQQKNRMAERRRQGHRITAGLKTNVKQILDREAKLLIRRSKRQQAKLAVESPKRIANLGKGSLQGWATSYFAKRLTTLGQENCIPVVEVNPYQTSITCPECGKVSKENRVIRDIFSCVNCKFTDHADKVAARNIALKGGLKHQGGILKRSEGIC